ncbi:hypothetical protein CTI12_AA053780 [Artemisia annua]|uniref:Uncharacterized protein n=1 Tax=Artemisia annua TaxID=35608 RepID=A0A2U1Q7K8_ARTAN|nr:hypothetical protein CTI12_AA053780 [Artemisia annua]
MDHNQDQLKHMGILEIFTQSFKTIFKCNKIFTQITLTLILPVAAIFIANLVISSGVLHFRPNPYHILFQTYMVYKASYHADETTDLSRHWIYFFLINIISIAVFYIYSTASIVYTITTVYTGDEVTYSKSIKVVTKWCRVYVHGVSRTQRVVGCVASVNWNNMWSFADVRVLVQYGDLHDILSCLQVV